MVCYTPVKSYSPVAQLVEQAAVNRFVAGSSPARGAKKNKDLGGVHLGPCSASKGRQALNGPADARWMGWTIDRRIERQQGIPRGLPYLTGFVALHEIEGQTQLH